MPIDFPNSPTTNQTYAVGNKTWVWDGEKWVLSPTNFAEDDQTILSGQIFS